MVQTYLIDVITETVVNYQFAKLKTRLVIFQLTAKNINCSKQSWNEICDSCPVKLYIEINSQILSNLF